MNALCHSQLARFMIGNFCRVGPGSAHSNRRSQDKDWEAEPCNQAKQSHSNDDSLLALDLIEAAWNRGKESGVPHELMAYGRRFRRHEGPRSNLRRDSRSCDGQKP